MNDNLKAYRCPVCFDATLPGAKYCATCTPVMAPVEQKVEVYNEAPFWLENYLQRQMVWSEQAFGPGDRTEGVMKHLESEINEVRQAPFGSPERLEELADLMILTMDAVWRNGFTATQFYHALEAKQAKNKAREWGPWQPTDTPAFHVKSS